MDAPEALAGEWIARGPTSPFPGSTTVPSSAVLSTFAVATVLVMVVPGPSVVYAVTRTVEHGRAAGVWSVLGLETGLLVHVLLAAAGVSALIASSATALTALRVGGACFLAWLGVRSWRRRSPQSHRPAEGAPPAGGTSRLRLFRDGLLVDLVNPKTALFFLAFLPQFVEPRRGPVGVQVLLLGALVVAVALVCDGSYTLLAGRLSRRLRTPEAQGRLSGASGVVYLGLAGLALAG
jgi:threonine/homoserine/homoserine lactone efflux protein